MPFISTSRPKVVYWNNIPAPYMVDRFEAIHRRANLDFKAWFNERTEIGRNWRVEESSWSFAYRFVPTVRMPRHNLHLALPALSESADLLVSLYAEPSFLIGSNLMHMRGISTAFWVEVTFDTWQPRNAWKEAIKRRAFANVDGVITAGDDGRSFAQRYGVPSEKIHIARHVVDVGFFQSSSQLARTTRDEIRNRLGVVGTTYLYVGRLWSGKGLEFLLRAFSAFQRKNDHSSLVLVGNGPEEDPLRRLCRELDLSNVLFVGFKHIEDLPALYSAADVFVFPTLGDPYGLVIDEAMACGLPVISTSAAGEIRERVHDGINGFIVPPANVEELAMAMARLGTDFGLRRSMGQASASRITGYTPDYWASQFEHAVARILHGQRRSDTMCDHG